MCENLINALMLLAKHKKDFDNPVKMDVQGPKEKCRLRIMMDGLMDAAVNIGSYRKHCVEKRGEPEFHDRLSGSCRSGKSG